MRYVDWWDVFGLFIVLPTCFVIAFLLLINAVNKSEKWHSGFPSGIALALFILICCLAVTFW